MRDNPAMMSEKQKMLAGQDYDSTDAELVDDRNRARALYYRLNQLPADASLAERQQLMSALIGQATDANITAPLFCDYGYNIRLGRNVYFNFNCTILDVASVSIGDNSLLGPNVQLYTALHPMSVAGRRSGVESGKPIRIGADVWIGGGAIVCPGVTIGDGSVIGAGSVVTRDIPALVFAAGNPCRVIRAL